MKKIKDKPEVTSKIILETRITKEDNTHPVKLRVYNNGKRKYYSIKGHSYTKAEYQEIHNPDSTNREFKRIRIKLVKEESRATDIIEKELDTFSFEVFEKKFQQNKVGKKDIDSLFEEKINELDQGDQLQSSILYSATKKSLKQFDSKFSFDKINPKYLKKYEKWMLSNGKSYTTIAIYLRNLRAIINTAIKDEIFHRNNYPFGSEKEGKYQIPESNNRKKALKLPDIEKLFKYKPINRDEHLALSYWLFSYLCNGMNMADIANLKNKNLEENSFTFIRQKTQNTAKVKTDIYVYLLPETKEIVKNIGNNSEEKEDYVFPIYSKGLSEIEKLKMLKQHIKITNKYIKQIAKKTNINEDITTYWARHSYSTIIKNSGASIEYIREQLGHQSTAVTQNYLDSFEEEESKKYTSKLIDFKKST